VLTAALPAGVDPDTTDTLAVDLTESEGQLLSGTMADANNLVTLCYCDGELVAYETAVLTGSYRYSLTYLRRGAYGTPITAHASGAQFGRFGPNDPAVFRYGYPANFIGQTIYVKLPAFNFLGQELQSLAAVSASAYTLEGVGTNPLDNPIVAALAAGTNEDWGTVATSVIGSADLGIATAAVGVSINLGTVP
jgi:hypothetical protein